MLHIHIEHDKPMLYTISTKQVSVKGTHTNQKEGEVFGSKKGRNEGLNKDQSIWRSREYYSP